MANLGESTRIVTSDLQQATVWLIRHGQSQANAGTATEHPKTIELTDTGRIQAQHVADAIDFAPRSIIVSPYIRTMDTARPLLAKLAQAGLSLPVQEWPIQEFTYLSPVRCRGTTAVDRQAWAREYWLRADPDWEDGDGAESYRSLMQRVERFSAQLANEAGPTVVFGHGMFFKAFVISLEHGTHASSEAMTRYRALESAAPIHNAQILRLARTPAHSWSVLNDYPMLLDRERLAQYVGRDPAFEREFLALLGQTTEACLQALAEPTVDIYAMLHAAKAGISVAAHEELRSALQLACDHTVTIQASGLTEEVRQVLRMIEPLMAQLSREIMAVISS
jgi:2,3-bisphosphoglycerate-dependent phosphoglycerate mutase